MRVKPRIYCNDVIQCEQTLRLDEAASHHLLRVLRMQPEDELIVFNGQGGEYLARLQSIGKKQAIVFPYAFCDTSRESPFPIHVGQALCRGDKMDWVIQKSVELGATHITPIFSDNSVKLSNDRLLKKQARWQQIAQSAAEQSGRTVVPTVLMPQSIRAWVHAVEVGMICDPSAEQMIWEAFPKRRTEPFCFAIGPESGFSTEELACATEAGWQLKGLGKRVLRAETAAVSVLSLLLPWTSP